MAAPSSQMDGIKHRNRFGILVFAIAAFAVIATTAGIFSSQGGGAYEYTSIRGRTVTIYGKGLYKHMSAEVAPQGIAQDWVTLLAGVPLLIFSFFKALRGSRKGRILLAGTLGYFLVTYLFYTVMAMYNALFLAYVILLGTSFYAFLITAFSFDLPALVCAFKPSTPVRTAGSFLIVVSMAIAFLWLSVVVPPLLNGTVIPVQTEHYTTLIVQGLDLAVLLPAGLISGVLLWKKRALGYLIAPVYLVFLSLLMTALTAKVLAMKIAGYDVFPVIFIIPLFNIVAILCSVALLRSIRPCAKG